MALTWRLTWENAERTHPMAATHWDNAWSGRDIPNVALIYGASHHVLWALGDRAAHYASYCYININNYWQNGFRCDIRHLSDYPLVNDITGLGPDFSEDDTGARILGRECHYCFSTTPIINGIIQYHGNDRSGHWQVCAGTYKVSHSIFNLLLNDNSTLGVLA